MTSRPIGFSATLLVTLVGGSAYFTGGVSLDTTVTLESTPSTAVLLMSIQNRGDESVFDVRAKASYLPEEIRFAPSTLSPGESLESRQELSLPPGVRSNPGSYPIRVVVSYLDGLSRRRFAPAYGILRTSNQEMDEPITLSVSDLTLNGPSSIEIVVDSEREIPSVGLSIHTNPGVLVEPPEHLVDLSPGSRKLEFSLTNQSIEGGGTNPLVVFAEFDADGFHQTVASHAQLRIPEAGEAGGEIQSSIPLRGYSSIALAIIILGTLLTVRSLVKGKRTKRS